jgi:hypothetical protein
MRPCNQCGRPVENSIHICQSCEAFNEENGYEPPPTVGLQSELPDIGPQKKDYSYTLLMLTFNLLLVAIGALIGFSVADMSGVLVGAAIGMIAGGTFMFLMRG